MYAIYGNMDPTNIPPMLVYIPYMDPMGRMMSHLFRFNVNKSHWSSGLRGLEEVQMQLNELQVTRVLVHIPSIKFT